MNNLLAVSWEMPPLSGPRAVQVTRTLCQLATLGWRSRVVCFGPRSTRYNQDYDVSPEAETEGAVRLIRVPSPEEWFVFRVLWRVVPALKHLPDEKRLWIGGAVRAARAALAEAPADLLVSFAQPWSDHLTGLALHRQTGLPWVAHFSDPWTDSPYRSGAPWQRRIWQRMEHDVIAAATRIVFVNEPTADRVMAKYPADWRTRVRIVPQGFDNATTTPSGPRTAGPLRLVYTGRFYDGVRTPETMLDALAALHRRAPIDTRLHVEFVGGAMEAYQRGAAELGLSAVVSFTGRMSPQRAHEAASGADVLVLIDAPSDGPNLFLPSKLVDYLPLRKPILGLTPAAGASADLLRKLGYPIVDPANAGAIEQVLLTLIDAHERGTLQLSSAHDEVSRGYDIRETTAAFHGILLEAIGAA